MARMHQASKNGFSLDSREKEKREASAQKVTITYPRSGKKESE